MAYWSEWLTPGSVSSQQTGQDEDIWDQLPRSIDGDAGTYAHCQQDNAYISFSGIPIPDLVLPANCQLRGAQIRARLSNQRGSSDPRGIEYMQLFSPVGNSKVDLYHAVGHTDAQLVSFGGSGSFSSALNGLSASQVGSISFRLDAYNPAPNQFGAGEIRLHTVEVRFWVSGPSLPMSETLELSSESNGAAIQALIAEIAESYLIKGGQAQKFIAARLLSDIVGMHGQRYGSELSLKVCAAKYYTWPVGLFHIPEFASLRMRSHDVLAMDDGIRIRQNSDGPMADLSATWIWVGDDADTMERWIRQTCDTPFSAQAEIFGQPQKIYGAWLSPPTIARRTRHIEVSGEMSIVW